MLVGDYCCNPKMFFLPLTPEWLILVFSVVILRIQLMCKLSSSSLQLVRKICFSIKRVQSYWVKRWLLLNSLLRILIRCLLFYQISLKDNMKAPDLWSTNTPRIRGVPMSETRQCLTLTWHIWLHRIMSISQIIIRVGLSCPMSVSVSLLHSCRSNK